MKTNGKWVIGEFFNKWYAAQDGCSLDANGDVVEVPPAYLHPTSNAAVTAVGMWKIRQLPVLGGHKSTLWRYTQAVDRNNRLHWPGVLRSYVHDGAGFYLGANRNWYTFGYGGLGQVSADVAMYLDGVVQRWGSK